MTTARRSAGVDAVAECASSPASGTVRSTGRV
jgi:hypothetical protein